MKKKILLQIVSIIVNIIFYQFTSIWYDYD